MPGRRFFLTGATGYIGGYVAEALVAQGEQVTALVRPGTDARPLERVGARIARGSILEPATLALDGQDVLIHMAAWVGFGIPRRKEAAFRQTNVQGTRNVLEAARRAKVPKAVHVSSVAALGDTGEGISTEESPRRGPPRSLYEETKVAAHGIALEYGDLDIAIAMPGMVVGRGSDLDFLFARLARGDMHRTLTGDRPTGWVHVRDVAEGVLQMATRGRGPYLLVDETLTVAGLFDALARRIGRPPPKPSIPMAAVSIAANAFEGWQRLRGKAAPFGRELVAGLRANLRYDSSRARRELGWSPRLFDRLAADWGPSATRPTPTEPVPSPAPGAP
jgi:dihydroflavonol-4-reductase